MEIERHSSPATRLPTPNWAVSQTKWRSLWTWVSLCLSMQLSLFKMCLVATIAANLPIFSGSKTSRFTSATTQITAKTVNVQAVHSWNPMIRRANWTTFGGLELNLGAILRDSICISLQTLATSVVKTTRWVFVVLAWWAPSMYSIQIRLQPH